MSRLPPNEWLHLAKRLAVGQKRRVRHNEERDCAMDVWNNGDSWSAYCHRCHMPGWVPKEHQQLNVQRVDPDRVSPVPADSLHLSQASAYEQKRIWELLTEKGCPPGVIPEEHVWYSRSSNRTLLRQGLQGLGRALSPQQQPKWLMYGDWWNQPRIWWTRYQGVGPMVLAPTAGRVLVVAEDALSAYKIAKSYSVYGVDADVCATLGTTLTAASLNLVAANYSKVLSMYDPDRAGTAGLLAMRKRLSVFGIPVVDGRPQTGDPKLSTLEELYDRTESVWYR